MLSDRMTVITALHDGKPVGMTASVVASVSLEPVLLLVCVDNRLWTHRALEESRRELHEIDAEVGALMARIRAEGLAAPMPDPATLTEASEFKG